MVSIGVPVYNDAKFLREALDSLLAQDYSNFELIISDNASQDATQEISREYAARDPRVSYHRNATNLGATENFNQAFRLSTGKYFMWAGGHDVWAPTYLSRCVQVLESDEAIVQCNSLAQNMSQDGKTIFETVRQFDTRGKGLLVRANLVLWQVSAFIAYSVIRSAALRQTRLLIQVGGPDLLLGFELSLLGPFALVPEALFFMRDHRGDRSRQPNRAQYFVDLQKRLNPAGSTYFGRFWRWAFTLEELRAVRRARLPFGQRIAVTSCVFPAYFVWFYPRVPEAFRRLVRGSLNRWASQPHTGGELK